MIEKPEELFVGYVAQKAIIEEDEKILFVKGKSPNAKWDLPGGRIHLDELPAAGLIRELEEELSVRCSIGKVVTVKRFVHDKNPVPFYFVGFAVKIEDDVANIQIPDDELSAFVWLSREEMTPDEVYSNCIEAIDDYFSLKI